MNPSDDLLKDVRAGAWWRRQAACVDAPSGIFFERKKQRTALDYCRGCPVSNCLDYALKYESEYGIFGGFTARQRTKYRPELTHYVKVQLGQSVWGAVAVLGSDDGLEQTE